MSLGDGLARALDRYTQAKARFGIKALLMGEYDLSQLSQTEPVKGNGKRSNGNGAKSALDIGTHGGRDNAQQGTFRLPPHDNGWEQAQYKVLCPECGDRLAFVEGCVKCEMCGFSQC